MMKTRWTFQIIKRCRNQACIYGSLYSYLKFQAHWTYSVFWTVWIIQNRSRTVHFYTIVIGYYTRLRYYWFHDRFSSRWTSRCSIINKRFETEKKNNYNDLRKYTYLSRSVAVVSFAVGVYWYGWSRAKIVNQRFGLNTRMKRCFKANSTSII